MCAAEAKLKKADFETDQDVRWCPGCGDYSILANVQKFLPTLDVERSKYVFISGIGCSSRFPYYMNTYGFHTIHGRAPAIATGVKLNNPELNVWMITGDGDALSIGANHIVHLLRRNLDINVLLFNNQIYGLTKGQYSPTSEVGKITKSSPVGSLDQPMNPLALILGAQASFIARTIDVDAKHMASVFERANNHRGTSFVEIYQNCNIFNDGAFDHIRDRSVREDAQLKLEHGKPMVYGKERNKGLKFSSAGLEVVEFPAESDPTLSGVMVYDETNRLLATALALLPGNSDFPRPVGVIFSEQRPTFDSLVNSQVEEEKKSKDLPSDPDEALDKLFHSGDTWLVN